MVFFDLSLPYNEPSDHGDKEVVFGRALRVKLATKAMELGYVGIAHNRSIKGVISDKDFCTIPLLNLGSLVKVSPRLASSIGFHRDLLSVPRATPFRQYTRLTVYAENNAQCLNLNSRNPILNSYDIVAVKPLNENAFNDACTKAEVDLISIDFAKMPFRLDYRMVKAAIQRGIYFEVKYCDLLKDAKTRRQVISNAKVRNFDASGAKLLVDWTKGKNLIISSGALSVTELRGPNDVINLMSLLGLSSERARAGISQNCRNMVAKVLKKKRFHKDSVRVELLSSCETFGLEQPLSGDCMEWDPLSNGEGDMLLADLAKAFDAASVVAHKSSKAIDFTSHGFQVKDIVGTEPLTQPPADKVMDGPVHSNQVSEKCMSVAASSDGNIGENKTISQIDMHVSEYNSKVEPTTIVLMKQAVGLRKCNSSQGEGLLLQNQTAESPTLVRCTKSDAASDVSMHTESDSEDKSPSQSGQGIPQSPVGNLNMATIAVDEVSIDCVRKEGSISGQGNDENHASIDDDYMKIDGYSEAIHEELEVEAQRHETGESNNDLPNLSSETTSLLRESDNSLSPEAVGQDHEQVSILESNETEVEEEPSVPYHNTFDRTMADKEEGEIETEINHQACVQSSEINNDRNSGKAQAKRSRVRLAQLRPLKPFLLQSRFKRISKRGKHRRV